MDPGFGCLFEQVEAVWTWFRFLMSRIPPGKKPIVLNLDETCVRYFYAPREGLTVADMKQDSHSHPLSQVFRNTTSAQMKRCISHIAIVAAEPQYQAQLPQIFLAAEDSSPGGCAGRAAFL